MLVVLTISRGLSGTKTAPVEKVTTCYKCASSLSYHIFGKQTLSISRSAIYLSVSVYNCTQGNERAELQRPFCLSFFHSQQFPLI